MTRLSEQWTKKKLVAHCASEETWYFSAASYWKQRYALIMIDVDCKKRGTPEGARAFLEFLAANYFPGMYIEVSTNGNGGHGYLLIDKYNLEGQSVNDILLHRLCPWLNMMFAVAPASRPEQALTREQALRAYTSGSAYAEFSEHEKGKLARGYLADMAVLSQDVLDDAVPLQALPGTTSLLTMINGEVAWRDPAFQSTPQVTAP